MFEFLAEIDNKLYDRYLTIEKNIKSCSNSFYDSYLDMQECFVKVVLENNNFEYDKETCGYLLRKNDVKEFFFNTLLVDEFTYNKMQDYTLKVNKHKHKNEKKIQIDTIVSYLKIFYDASSAYAKYKNINCAEYDANSFIEIYGIYEKENSKLKTELELLKEDVAVYINEGKLKDADIKEYKQLVSNIENKNLSLEEQNNELYKQISMLKDIKISSMETKLNKTIDLLNELTDSVIENRAISYAVGDTICGRDAFKSYIEQAKKDINNN